MKSLKKIVIILLIFSPYLIFSQSCDQSGGIKDSLNKKEKTSLLKMLDEEKLAHDVYSYFSDKYNLPIFKNISNAEQRHFDAVLGLVKKYNVRYTKINDKGKFMNPDYENLYKKLTEKGLSSVTEALRVGAEIEDLDIYDLDEALKKEITTKDIKIVYQNIRTGSYHHIKAFTNVLNRYGESYSAKYISPEEYQKIIQ